MSHINTIEKPRIAVALALFCVALGAAAQEPLLPSTLIADPAAIELPALRSAGEVRIFADETRAAPAHIEKAAIDGSYARFFHVLVPTERPGVVRVVTRPDRVEAGSYDLRVHADGQQIVVPVLATLSEEETIIERDAEMLGQTEEAVRIRYGLAKPLWRENLEITLPESYTEGAILTLDLEAHPNRWFTWVVNDIAVLEGHGENVLRLPLDEAGPLKLAVEVRDRGTVVAGWEGALRVDPEPAIPLRRPANETFRLMAPDGFEHYEWRVDDEILSREQTCAFRFPTPGAYAIECRALDPENPDAAAQRLFRRITWRAEIR